jgi:hypothetical protein
MRRGRVQPARASCAQSRCRCKERCTMIRQTDTHTDRHTARCYLCTGAGTALRHADPAGGEGAGGERHAREGGAQEVVQEDALQADRFVGRRRRRKRWRRIAQTQAGVLVRAGCIEEAACRRLRAVLVLMEPDLAALLPLAGCTSATCWRTASQGARVEPDVRPGR